MHGIAAGDVATLSCPTCRGTLAFAGTLAAGRLAEGTLRCAGCAREWPVTDGLPRLVDEGSVRGVDRLMRSLYDLGAPVHDPACRYLLPLLQLSSEADLRAGYLPRLELARLAPSHGTRARILEVGIGGGANLPLIAGALPPGAAVDVWGVDLSANMLAQCRRRIATDAAHPVRLVLADGHALPFPDGTFDRVLNVGGIGGYRDPGRALAEMARVARRGTPIVVVDEQLDPARAHGLYPRLAFRALTFYDPAPRCPRALLPADAVDVREEQVSRFYYCLTYRMAPTARISPAAP